MADKKSKVPSLPSLVIKGMQEKKGRKIVSLDLRKIENAVAEYFIICHGPSRPHVEALAESVLETVAKASGDKPWHKEGMENAEWILIDYVNVVVHIFQEDVRSFFQLEKLWDDAESEYIKSDE
jgi:ribosome-associated protein